MSIYEFDGEVEWGGKTFFSLMNNFWSISDSMPLAINLTFLHQS